jgi:hypothetical protein
MVISLNVQTSRMLQKISLPVTFSIILILMLVVMTPVSALGVSVAAATTQGVPANGTAVQAPVSTGTVTTSVTSLPVTTGTASVVTTPSLVNGAETSAPVTLTVISTTAAEPTTTSPVSLPTVIAGIGIAGLAMILIKRH